MNRRKLFGFAAVPAVALLPNNEVKAETTKLDISNSKPLAGPVIQIQAQRMKAAENKGYATIMAHMESYGPTLGITVGQDGHMWLKVNDEWKRVVTE